MNTWAHRACHAQPVMHELTSALAGMPGLLWVLGFTAARIRIARCVRTTLTNAAARSTTLMSAMRTTRRFAPRWAITKAPGKHVHKTWVARCDTKKAWPFINLNTRKYVAQPPGKDSAIKDSSSLILLHLEASQATTACMPNACSVTRMCLWSWHRDRAPGLVAPWLPRRCW